MPARTTFTPDLAAEVLTRLSRGRSLHNLCRDPDMPGEGTILAWARKNQTFAAHLRAARAVPQRPRRRGAPRRSTYTEALGRGICDALKAGFTLTEICASDAAPVTTHTVRNWARRRPDFAAALADATRPRPGPRGLIIGRGRRGGYTPQRGQAVLDRLLEGRALADICRDPDMPSAVTLSRWRSRHIDFHLAWQTTRRLQLERLLDDVLDAADQGGRPGKARRVIGGLAGRGVEPFWVGVAAVGGVEGWRGADGGEGEADGEAAAGMGHNWRGR